MELSIYLLVTSILLFVGVLASKVSMRIGIPLLIAFIGVGMLAGSDGFGGIYFDDPEPVQFMGMIALNFILFSGGMDTRMRDIKPIWRAGISLASLGVIITAVLVGFFAHLMWPEFTVVEGLLLGAIVSSTDAAAIFTIFRTRTSNLKHNLRPILEFESGSNDPMAYFLTVTLIFLLQNPDVGGMGMALLLIKGFAIGGAAGLLMGKAIVYVLRHIDIKIEGLYPVLVISMALFTSTIADVLGGNGILAIYLAGIVVGNHSFARKQSIIKFYGGFTWLMQIMMFLLMGLLSFPSHMPRIASVGIYVTLFLIFAARPAAVFISTMFSRMTFKDRIFLIWGGLRGASPIIFATLPMVAGLEDAEAIFNIVFFVSCTSVLLQGSTLFWIAKKLKLVVPDKSERIIPIELSDKNTPLATEVEITYNSYAAGLTLKRLDIPPSVLIILIERNNESFIPNGDTMIKHNDKIYIVSDEQDKTNSFVNYLNEKK